MTDRAAQFPSLAEAADYCSPGLQELHDSFRQYVEVTPLGILLINGHGTISYCNQSVCRCFGYEAGELLGKPIEILVPDAVKPDHVQLRNLYLACPELRLMQGREVRGRHKSGIEIDVAIGLNPLMSDDELQVACTVLDLSEKREAERSLENFFDLSLDLFCIASTNGFLLRVNPNFSLLLGYSEQDLLSRPFLDFVHPDDLAATQAAMEALLSGKPVTRFRNRYRQFRGTYLWIEWSASAILQNDLIYAVGRDVTEEFRHEQELLVREQREQAILENTPAVVYIKGINGKYLYVNQRFADLFSLDSITVQGKSDIEIFPKSLAENFSRNDLKVVESREKILIEELAPHQDGLHTYISVKFPLFDSNGDVSAVAGISTDITEHIQNQKIQEQLKIATLFQKKLFPARAPCIPGLDLAGAAAPVANLCGDYYDFIVTGSARVTIAVGDVSGHGLGPALAMVEVRSILRGLLHYGVRNDLVGILRKLNELLCDDLPAGAFVSLFLAELEINQARLHYAGAGHMARLFHRDGRVEFLGGSGPVLGLIETADFLENPTVKIGEGDLLLICTDGVIETMNQNNELFGSQRLIEHVTEHRRQESSALIQSLFARVNSFAAGRPIADDITAVAVKVEADEAR